MIEKLAGEMGFKDFCNYPRGKNVKKDLNFSFSGIKTAVLYDLVKRGAFDLKTGIIKKGMTEQIKREVASSLLVCIAEIFEHKVRTAFKKYPEVRGLSLVGGVAANKFISEKLRGLSERRGKQFASPTLKFCGDNAAMIAFVGALKAERGEFSDFDLDVF
jgi:N6-L-threonylcarbamoyladenine synthase